MPPSSMFELPPTITSLTNISSSRHRPPSLVPKREEGWTEVWGVKSMNESNNKANGGGDGDGSNDSTGGNGGFHPTDFLPLPPRYITKLQDGCDDIGNQPAPPSTQASLITLSQHRVAWFEQIILRMCFIPHTVENSGYNAREGTGALPCLLDLRCGDCDMNTIKKGGGGTNLNTPVLVGRNHPGGLGSCFHSFSSKKGGTTMHPSWFVSSGSHIVDYLRLCHSEQGMENFVLFPEHLNIGAAANQPINSPHHSDQHNQSKSSINFPPAISGDASAYASLIEDKLNYILLALRYGNDPAWEEIYRPQCIRASLDPDGKFMAEDIANEASSPTNPNDVTTTKKISANRGSKPFFSMYTYYQIYSERKLALQNLLPSSYAINSSTHGGLSLELFRYNDYRYSSSRKPSPKSGLDDIREDEDKDRNTSDKEKEEELIHQHHPFSPWFPSFGGVGGGDSGKVNVYRAMEYADVFYSSLENKLESSDLLACLGGGASDGKNNTADSVGDVAKPSKTRLSTASSVNVGGGVGVVAGGEEALEKKFASFASLNSAGGSSGAGAGGAGGVSGGGGWSNCGVATLPLESVDVNDGKSMEKRVESSTSLNVGEGVDIAVDTFGDKPALGRLSTSSSLNVGGGIGVVEGEALLEKRFASYSNLNPMVDGTNADAGTSSSLQAGTSTGTQSDGKKVTTSDNPFDTRTTYFLGTTTPTYVDALIFSHLAEALCDVHLILVLAKHPRLVNYFQWMYNRYFGTGYFDFFQAQSESSLSPVPAESVEWIRQNNYANARNAYNQIPEAGPSNMKVQRSTDVVEGVKGKEGMLQAVQLMEKIAIHCHQLDEALKDAVSIRSHEGGEKSLLDGYHRPFGSRLYQWCLGGDVEFWGSGESKKKSTDEAKRQANGARSSDRGGEHGRESQSDPTDPEGERRERLRLMKRESRNNDELWLSGVVATLFIAIAASSYNRVAK